MDHLKIITASAGSGKTFRITAEYLKLLFSEYQNFRNILAVTFTNKATEEMKTRIVRELYALANGDPSEYISILQKTSGTPESTLRVRAKSILYHLLHNYSHFYVGTIDSFFQKVLRVFIREIGIQTGYALELDDMMVLEDSIDRLYGELDNNPELRHWMTQLAISKIESGKSWNFKSDLTALGKEVFKEEFKANSEKLIRLIEDKDFLNGYIKDLNAIIHSFENFLKSAAKESLDFIADHSLSIDDFKYGKSGPVGIFLKLSQNDFKWPGKRVFDAESDKESFYNHKSPKTDQLTNCVNSGLYDSLCAIINHYRLFFKSYRTAVLIHSNIYTLGILSDVAKQIRNYCQENNLFLLSDAAQFIFKIIDNNDTPFIYEKFGNYFNHFMIDEFQDTSQFQWHNFKPLISNSLSQGYINLLVGDVKQSIYRWRNSSWKILAHQVEEDFKPAPLTKEALLFNWRSCKEIINFNNSLFSSAAGLLQNYYQNEIEESGYKSPGEYNISSLYKDVIQQFPEKETRGQGYIKFRFFEKDQVDKDKQRIKEQVLNTLLELTDKQFQPGDLAILVRTRREGKQLADYILAYNQQARLKGERTLEIISDESLFLGNSSTVNFIISILKYIIFPNDEVNNLFLIHEYLLYIQPGDKNRLKSIQPDKGKIADEFINFLPEGFTEFLDKLKSEPLYELVEKITGYFSLHQKRGELPYLQGFQDMILEYVRKNKSDIFSFLQYWEERGITTSIPLFDVNNAIRILTIHKSKGLEFKAVLIPFCDWQIEGQNANQTILWCIPNKSPFSGLPVVPVKYSSVLKDTIFSDFYFDEKLKNYIDNLNLLYVALTRAREALFCFGEQESGKETKLSTVADLITMAFKNQSKDEAIQMPLNLEHYYSNENKSFEYGKLNSSVKNSGPAKSADQWEYPSSQIIHKLQIVRRGADYFSETFEDVKSPVNYGKIMHEIFQNISTKEDVDKAVNKLFYEGKISKEEIPGLQSEITTLLENSDINAWFDGTWKVIAEKDILHPSGKIRRPDRVMQKEDIVIVVDFKFGESETKEHKQQVKEYLDIIGEMKFARHLFGYLWYFKHNKLIKV
ncbi:MAG: UvrD-helicase domain-containing protein [Bacteroidales bacterium]|nr:UvrD-helicase domain-containing protein [Bacteroidales bacterium]